MLRKGVRVKDFYALGGKVYFTQADNPYEVLRMDDPQSAGYLGEPMSAFWETPWFDLGKPYEKSDFTLRFTADADADDLPLEIVLETDRRARRKVVLLKQRRMDYKVAIRNRGGRVKLRMASEATAGWRIYGGVMVEYAVEEE